MIEIRPDIQAIARRMAIAMAVMHWGARTNSRDVEFVLGASSKEHTYARTAAEVKELPPQTYTGPASAKIEDFYFRTVKLWVLDFNQVRSITMDENGVAQAVDAARVNDPYLPKPLQNTDIEKRVWDEFAMSYLRASHTTLRADGASEEVLALPRLFLQGLVDAERIRQQERCSEA
ncbi:hypothetical protein VTK56DRAFT_5943 [Thermocarpiscus australiensis]